MNEEWGIGGDCGIICYNYRMTKKTIVTAGRKYLDIDAYASMISYRELLKKTLDGEVLAFSTTKVNQTVPQMLRDLRYRLDEPVDTGGAKFVLVDVSNPDFFDTFVKKDNIVEIIDHHAGYEEFWRANKAVKSQIEPVGAVCTQIYERFVEAGEVSLIDIDLAKLLIAGILDNTINLKSKMTTKRDLRAYSELKKIGGFGDDFGSEYFLACEKEQMKDLKTAILGDMKTEWVSKLLPEAIGQIIILHHSRITREMLEEVFVDYDRWMINVISLEEGRSYLYCDGAETLVGLAKLFNKGEGQENLLVLDDFVLRKEILRRGIEQGG